MNLIDAKSGEQIRGKIELFMPSKIESAKIKDLFSFNWDKEKAEEVFSLTRIDHNEVVGLMSTTNIIDELRVQINLIESSILNRGKGKIVKNIPHCLISFAAKQSFALGYDGFVSLYPKTELIDYYKNEYGFDNVGNQLAIYGKTSFELIQKYLP